MFWSCPFCRRQYALADLRRRPRVVGRSCLWRRCLCGRPFSISATCTSGAIFSRAKQRAASQKDSP
jgi:hypothetical protein